MAVPSQNITIRYHSKTLRFWFLVVIFAGGGVFLCDEGNLLLALIAFTIVGALLWMIFRRPLKLVLTQETLSVPHMFTGRVVTIPVSDLQSLSRRRFNEQEDIEVFYSGGKVVLPLSNLRNRKEIEGLEQQLCVLINPSFEEEKYAEFEKQFVDGVNATKPELLKTITPVLDEISESIHRSMVPCVHITPLPVDKLRPWESKFSGLPYLMSKDDVPKDARQLPMQFLAQINFEEMPPLDPFPQKGLLQFWIADHDLYSKNYFHTPKQKKSFLSKNK